MNATQKDQLLKAKDAFIAIEALIEKGVIVLNAKNYTCEVLPEMWTAWLTSEDVALAPNIVRNIMMYCDMVNSRLENGNTVGEYHTDLMIHALAMHNYYLGKYNRTAGFILP